MNTELPRMMDNYIKSRSKGLEATIPQDIKQRIRQAPTQ
jgi:hypothetical protein